MPNLTEQGRIDSDILFKMTERQIMEEAITGRNNWSNLETPLSSYNEMPVKKGSPKPGEIRHISGTVQKIKPPDTPLDLNISCVSQTAIQN